LQPFINTDSESPFYFMGLPTLLRATSRTTNGGFGLVEGVVMPPGFASPYHTHHLEDEAFYVLEGEMAFVCDGQWMTGSAGTFVFGPRNLAHGFKVIGDAPARMLLLCTPGGFEQFVADLSEPSPAPPDMAKLVATAARYQIDVHGPLPEMPDSAARRAPDALTEAVDQTRAQHVRAIRSGDLELALDVFAPGAVFLPPGTPALQGDEALRGWFTHILANFSLPDFAVRPGAVDRHAGIVIEHGDWTATLQPRDGSPGRPVGGTYVTVYSRLADGRVRVTRDTFNGL
jgi:quercetin dioxygenase-like cupin family protein/ketosteroid isomerase-like protein